MCGEASNQLLTFAPSACLPTIRLLLVKLFPVLTGSSARSKQQYYNHEGSELRNMGQSQSRKSYKSRDIDTVSLGSNETGSPGFGQDQNIVCQTSYTVQHSKISQVSLVSHDLEKSRA
jgi:hypothetical protein